MFPGDGKIQVQNACSQTTTNVYYYQEPGLYANFAVGDWRGKDMLRVSCFPSKRLSTESLEKTQTSDRFASFSPRNSSLNVRFPFHSWLAFACDQARLEFD